MLISFKKQFIYTKTFKTAGTSVESYFEKYCMPDGEWEFSHMREQHVSESGIVGYRGINSEGKAWFNHMSAEAIRASIGNSIWENYFKFCVIRNPFDKVISGFHFLELSDSDTNQKSSRLENHSLIERFRKWVVSGGAERVVDREKYIIDSKICIDFFVRYEELESGLNHICQRLDIPYELNQLPRLKISARDRDLNINSYYDQSSVDVVKKLFEFELDYFGYLPPK